jgi:hypothetical protein
MYHSFIFSFSLTFAACALSVRAGFLEDWERLKNTQPEGYLCGRGTNIVIDGKLDEKSWAEAPWTREFQDIEGTAKPAPRFKTRAKMLWDDAYFYIAANMEEPHVWGTLTNHDAVIFHDPDFEVFIDPDGDRQNYYEFEMNALNTGWDLRLPKAYIDGGPALNDWEIPGLKTAVHVRGTLNDPRDTDHGWSIEIAIPWKVLGEFSGQKTPPKEHDVWRVDFSRVEWHVTIENGRYVKVPGKKEDNWVWSPTGIIDMHRPENWGYVKFTSKPAGTYQPQRDRAVDTLLAVYYAQKASYDKIKRWAESLDGLGTFPNVNFKRTQSGFEASVEGKTIREDGLLR